MEDPATSYELRPSGADDEALPDIAQAIPPPPPRVVRPAEYRQEASGCGASCSGEWRERAECLGCGRPCGDFFDGRARCVDCGATFCGACRAAGLRHSGSFFACDEGGWRCADAVACETMPHALRLVRAHWGPVDGATGLDCEAEDDPDAPNEEGVVDL